MGFAIILRNVLVLMAYMAMGFTLCKTKLAKAEHSKTLSSYLVYCATPGMILASFQSMEYNAYDARMLLLFFLLSLALQFMMFGLLILALGRRMQDGKFRILNIGSFMGNVGFLGQPLVAALFPDQPIVSCYSMMFAASMNVMIYTIGEYLISRDRKYISMKRLLTNPAILTMFFVIPLYILNIHLPETIVNMAVTLRATTAPLCMVILGLRLASMNLKEVFGQPFAYLVSALKLLVFPLLCFAVASILPWFDYTFRVSIMIIAGTPCASIILALAEMHDCEQKNAACTVLVSTILCVVTLPLLTLILT